LQRFVAVDEVTIGSNAKIHVLVALEGKFLIVKLEYLAGLLSVFKPLDLHGRYPQQGRWWGSP
jgi:hypothetical protein